MLRLVVDNSHRLPKKRKPDPIATAMVENNFFATFFVVGLIALLAIFEVDARLR